MAKFVRPTDEMWFNDGQMRGEVIDIDVNEVKIRTRDACELPSGVQIRLSSTKYENFPLLRGSDVVDLQNLYEKFPFEYVSIPCVQSAKDLQEFKFNIGELGSKIEIVSKIDTMEGVQSYESICEHTDAIIIQR